MGYEGTKNALGVPKVIESKIELNNRTQMPIVGFGTYQITGQSPIRQALDAALRAGYRSFDSATSYKNELFIGQALRELLPKYNLHRSQVFITSKLSPADHGAENAREAVQKSVSNVGLDYLDLYLIHWPGVSDDEEESRRIRKESWMALENMYSKGRLKAIGVSNYSAKHLKELLSYAHIKPAVNQVEFHLYLRQPQVLLDLCASANILLQSYCTLGGGNSNILSDPVAQSIAGSLGKSCAQVLLRWALQEGFAVIPKSTRPQHISENSELDFELSEEHMASLRNVTKRERYGGNPERVP